MKKIRKKLVNIKNARKGEYQRIIKEIAETDACPFCKENFKYHKKPIFKRSNGWFLTNNSWPYKNSEYHLIIIGDKHKENFFQLSKKDLAAVSYLTNWAIKKFKIKGGGLVIRFGDTNFTGASVNHIHFHLISPKINKKTGRSKTVNFPIG